MNGPTLKKMTFAGAPVSARQGGDTRILLSPTTVGSTSGFMGAVALGPSDRLSGQRHPYSEKFVYAVSGRTRVVSGDDEIVLEANEAVLLPKDADHRMWNETPDGGSAFLVLFLSPLAPRPDLGHVDTEPVARPECGPPLVGAAGTTDPPA